MLSPEKVRSVSGENAKTHAGRGAPLRSNRANRVRVKPPPALSPPTTIRALGCAASTASYAASAKSGAAG